MPFHMFKHMHTVSFLIYMIYVFKSMFMNIYIYIYVNSLFAVLTVQTPMKAGFFHHPWGSCSVCCSTRWVFHGQEVQGKQDAEVKGHEDDPTSSKAIATSSRDCQAGAHDVCHKERVISPAKLHSPCNKIGKRVSRIFDASPSMRRKARKQVQCRNLL